MLTSMEEMMVDIGFMLLMMVVVAVFFYHMGYSHGYENGLGDRHEDRTTKH